MKVAIYIVSERRSELRGGLGWIGKCSPNIYEKIFITENAYASRSLRKKICTCVHVTLQYIRLCTCNTVNKLDLTELNLNIEKVRKKSRKSTRMKRMENKDLDLRFRLFRL